MDRKGGLERIILKLCNAALHWGVHLFANYAALAEIVKKHYIRCDDSYRLGETIETIQEIIHGNDNETVAERDDCESLQRF